MGQNPGASEEAQGKPFVGDTGAAMERKYLKVAGLSREDVSIDNAYRCRFNHKNDLPPLTQTIAKEALAHCTKAHRSIPDGTRVVVSQGDYALYSLTGQSSSTDWRGYALSLYGQPHLSGVWVPRRGDIAVLATVHLARLFRDPTLTLATLSDWAKVPRLLAGKWPRSAPEFSTNPPDFFPDEFALDTEFTRADRPRLIRWSLANDEELCAVEADNPNPIALNPYKTPRLITQYAPADVQWLDEIADLAQCDMSAWEAFHIDDTVWKHSTLYSDHPHDLNYLGSLYSSYNRHKHLSEVEPQLYAAMDAKVTWEVDTALNKEFLRDPLSRRVYEEIDRPVLEYFVKAQYAGQRVDKARVKQVMGLLEVDRDEAQARATAVTGWPMKLSSPQQVAHRLYAEEKLGKR